MNTIKTYSQLCKFSTFEKRFEYLKIGGQIGVETFGFERYLNQSFYHSREWEMVRDKVILRDNGCDLGVDGYELVGRVIIHHMNPITRDDIIHRTEILLNPEYLIATCKRTHDALHYGGGIPVYEPYVERTRNDTCPWKR